MASILRSHGASDVFACANPKDTILNDPIDLPGFTDPFLSNPSSNTTINLLDIFLAKTPSCQPFASFIPHNQSSLISYDGAPVSQYHQSLCLTGPQDPGQCSWEPALHDDDHHHHSPTTSEDYHYGITTEYKAPGPTTQNKQATRKPGRRPSKQHDKQREKFLEKNRIAANKHQSRYDEQLTLNSNLKEEVSQLRGEALDLQQALLVHAECDNGPIRDYINKKIGGYVRRNKQKLT